jgi:hypothetical protein
MRPFRLGDIDRAQPLYEEYLTMECQRLGWAELDLPLSLRYDGHVRTRRPPPHPQLQLPHAAPTRYVQCNAGLSYRSKMGCGVGRCYGRVVMPSYCAR